MGTQGMVSIVDAADIVRFKIVAGCGGQKAESMAKAVRCLEIDTLTVDALYDIAVELELGCKDCLVVMGERESRYESDDDVPVLYRQTFKSCWFCPRSEEGTVFHAYRSNLYDGNVSRFSPEFQTIVERSSGTDELTRRLIDEIKGKPLMVCLPALGQVFEATLTVGLQGAGPPQDEVLSEILVHIQRIKRLMEKLSGENNNKGCDS